MANKAYSASEMAQIMQVFSGDSMPAKKELAKALGKPVATLYSKYRYEVLKEENGGFHPKNRKKNPKRQVQVKNESKSDIIVTHLKPVDKNPVVTIGTAKVTIPSKTFKISGVLIEC